VSRPKDGEVYFEHIVIGNVTKCTAIDAATGVEAAVSGPANAPPEHLRTLALRALKRRLAAIPDERSS
jgi:hypothetical protein